jgi:cold shock protein
MTAGRSYLGSLKNFRQARSGKNYIFERGVRIPMAKEVGKVKWFNNAKGYGFIERNSGGDVFVHHTAIQMNGFRTLAEGDPVSFSVTTGPKGLQAEDVTKAEE